MPPPAVLERAAGMLARGGVAEPRCEALRIWRDLTPVSDAEFLQAVQRRAGGEPLAYVTGQAGFRHLVLSADRRALIPRPETEMLVELALRAVPRGRVADVGTGSGCIALSLASEGQYDAVVAVDRSASALALASVNRDLTGAARVQLIRGDLTEPLVAESLDAIVSNPPYLTDREWEGVDPSVGLWEPAEALAAGPDGLAPTRRLLEDGRRVLRPGGRLLLELDCRRAPVVVKLACEFGWREVQVVNDLFGRERYLLARRSEP